MKKVFYFILFFSVLSCKKTEDFQPSQIPILSPLATTNVVTSTTSVTIQAKITDPGDGPVTERGICYAKTHNPTVNDLKVISGTGTGSFTVNISGLTPGTVYYFKAYAKNKSGIAYTNEVEIITDIPSPLQLATVATIDAPLLIDKINMIYRVPAQIIDSGTVRPDSCFCSPAFIKSIVYAKTPNPTISNAQSSPIKDSLQYYFCNILLEPNTTYYFRASATNIAGTSYGNEISFTTPPASIQDSDGNVYETVKIGNQIWMAENLKTSKLSDGTNIQQFTNSSSFDIQSTPGWAYVNYNASQNATYGKHYNWYCVSTNKICPAGWKVPSVSDWNQLLTYVGAKNGKHLKSTSLWPFSYPGDNTTGFNAVPAGNWMNPPGTSAPFWTSTNGSTTTSYFANIAGYSDTAIVVGVAVSHNQGLSIRCIKQ